MFVNNGHDDTDQRGWYRYQVVDTAKRLDYFANIRDFHSWVRIAFDTTAGRSEILLSFHTVGREYRGVIGASMCFYRRQQADGRGAATALASGTRIEVAERPVSENSRADGRCRAA